MLSVIIPCYNSGKYLPRLLDSLVDQHIDKAEMEVIISDDCSPEPYDDVLERYKDKLTIIKTSTKYNCCPGNTRQAGVDVARGRWYVFADHDDAFMPDVFEKVRAVIRKSKDAHMIVTDFIEVMPDTDEQICEHSNAFGWTHGKFYNAKWWKSHGLHYKKDLKSHEDIYLSTLCTCALHEDKDNGKIYLPIKSYKWTAHPESLSRKEDKMFIETHFNEYLEATGYAYLDFYKRNKDLNFALFHCVAVALYAYFYTMGVVFRDPNGFDGSMLTYSARYIKALKDTLEISNTDLIRCTMVKNGEYYWETMQAAKVATGPYVPLWSFEQFLVQLPYEEEGGSPRE